jgi:hypothetical protein
MEIVSEDTRVTINGTKSVTVNGNGPVFIYSNSLVMILGKNSNKLFPSTMPSKTFNDIPVIINGNGPVFMYSKGSITINGDGYVSKIG